MSDDTNNNADRTGAGDKPSAAPPAMATMSFQDACNTAYMHFYKKLEAVWHSVDIRQTLAEAEFELHGKLASFAAPERELERCEARSYYLRLAQQLHSPERQRTKVAFAFERYLDEIQAIWRRPDIHTIDPREISIFSESVAWAAYHASLRPSR